MYRIQVYTSLYASLCTVYRRVHLPICFSEGVYTVVYMPIYASLKVYIQWYIASQDFPKR